MGEPSVFTFEQQVRVAKRLQRIARLIDKELAAAGAPRMPWSFYTWGGNRAQYVSNTDRADAIKAMKECIERWEKGSPDEPPIHQGGFQ